MIQFGSTRSNVYGSTSRSVGVSSPSFMYSIATTRRSAIPRDSVATSSSSSSSERVSGVWWSSNCPNVSSSFLRTRSSGVCTCAAIDGPTMSSARRIARASSGVSRGASRKTSPYSSLSTRTALPSSSA